MADPILVCPCSSIGRIGPRVCWRQQRVVQRLETVHILQKLLYRIALCMFGFGWHPCGGK